MTRSRWLISALLAAGFLVLYLSGLAAVPFHPDESSWLTMSADFAALFLHGHPEALAWQPGQPVPTPVAYRLLNAPLPKYLMGLGWWLAGYTPADLNADWAWPATWDQNVAAGHVPAPGMLLAARWPGAALSALSAVLMFWIGCEAGGTGVGLAAALLLGLNPLVLLHGRRAMAEGAALFFSLLAVWGGLRLVRMMAPPPRRIESDGNEGTQPAARVSGPARRRFLTDAAANAAALAGAALAVGALIGLAIAGKQTAIPLLPSTLLALAPPMLRQPGGLGRRLARLAGLGAALGLAGGLTFWALNPILYCQPLGVAQAMWAARADLAQQQTETNAAVQPGSVTPDPAARLRAAALEVYLRPPAVWDLPVYLDHLAPQAQAYFAQPLNWPARWPGAGALVAALGLVGAAFSALRLVRARLGPRVLAEQAVWWWALGTLGLTLLAIPFDWQRYFLPLVPPACLFAALGLGDLARPLAARWQGGKQHHPLPLSGHFPTGEGRDAGRPA